MISAQIDPLHDDGEMFAKALKHAGVDVAYPNFDGVTHELFGMAAVVDKAKDAQKFAADRLKAALGKMSPERPIFRFERRTRQRVRFSFQKSRQTVRVIRSGTHVCALRFGRHAART